MKYSIILTAYNPDGQMTEITEECIRNIKLHSSDYELIVVNKQGLATALNTGLEDARGEYLIHICNDVMIEEDGWLDKLAIPGFVTGYKEKEFFLTKKPQLDACVWCMPRALYEKIGGWDEQFSEGYGFDDNDFFFRAEEAGYPIKAVPIKLLHKEYATYGTYWPNGREQLFMRNQMLFQLKWQHKLNTI